MCNILVFGLSAVATIYIRRDNGNLGMLTSAESLIAIGTVLYGAVRVGRWYRDVKPPEPKRRRAKDKGAL
jgi:hypothetical protein